MTKMSTCLWFDGQAEDAARFYVSVFRNSKILATTHYPEGVPVPMKAGSVMTVQFVLDGMEILALNGGPQTSSHPRSRSSCTATPSRRSTTSGES